VFLTFFLKNRFKMVVQFEFRTLYRGKLENSPALIYWGLQRLVDRPMYKQDILKKIAEGAKTTIDVVKPLVEKNLDSCVRYGFIDKISKKYFPLAYLNAQEKKKEGDEGFCCVPLLSFRPSMAMSRLEAQTLKDIALPEYSGDEFEDSDDENNIPLDLPHELRDSGNEEDEDVHVEKKFYIFLLD